MTKKLPIDLKDKKMSFVGCRFPIEVRAQLMQVRNSLNLANLTDVMRLIIDDYCKRNKIVAVKYEQ